MCEDDCEKVSMFELFGRIVKGCVQCCAEKLIKTKHARAGKYALEMLLDFKNQVAGQQQASVRETCVRPTTLVLE